MTTFCRVLTHFSRLRVLATGEGLYSAPFGLNSLLRLQYGVLVDKDSVEPSFTFFMRGLLVEVVPRGVSTASDKKKKKVMKEERRSRESAELDNRRHGEAALAIADGFPRPGTRTRRI
jgi:hypothetical protein